VNKIKNLVGRKRNGGVRLGLSFGLLILIVICVGWLGLHRTNRAEVSLKRIIDEQWIKVQLLREAQAYSNLNSRITLESFLAGDEKDIDPQILTVAGNSEKISKLIATLRSRVVSTEEGKLLDDIEAKRAPYVESYRRALWTLTSDKQPAQARTIMVREAMPLLVDYHKAWDSYVAYQGRQVDLARADEDARNRNAQLVSLLLIALAIVFAVIIAVGVTGRTIRDMARRQQAEDALQASYDELETKVRERTSELAAANADLQTEAAERKSVETALRSSELRHRQIVDCASDPIYRTGTDGRFTFVNPSAAALVKRSVEECVGLHFLELVQKDGRERAAQFYRDQMTGKIPVTYFEFPAVTKGGADVWIGQNVQLIIEHGKVSELQGLARDITARKEIEQQLQDSEQRYRLLFEANPQPMWVYDLETLRFLAVNSAAVTHYGFSHEEFLAMTIKDIRPPGEVRALLDSVGSDGLDESGTWKHQKKDGTILEVEITSHQLDFAGRPGKLVLAFDVTARKQVESEVLLQKARFQQLFENTPMGILRLDSNDCVIEANRAFESMFQFSIEELRGQSLNQTFVPETRVAGDAELSFEALEGRTIKKETVRQRKDGSLVPVQVYGLPIVANEELVGGFAIYLDLTEQKRLEAERQAVFAIIQGAISISDLGDLFKLIHRSISSLIYAENCFVALHDPATDLMHYEFWVDKLDPRPGPNPAGKGFSGSIVRTGQPMLLDRELTNEFVRRGEIERIGASSASWLGVPLRTHSRTIGVLVVQHYEDEHAYNQRDLEFLMSVGSQIALAIERKQAEHALQDANQRALIEYESLVERIAALGQTLGNARDLTIIFRALRDFAAASVPCDGVVISLYDREKKTRRPAYLWTDNKEFDTGSLVEIPVKDGLTGTAITTGSVIINNDYQAMLCGKVPVLVGECDDERTPHSALSAPMTVMGRTVGCVEIQSYQSGAFEQEHATAMRMAANLAANAVENVILIEREEAKEEQLRQAQKMESIGTLAGGIAHDFNNLMTAVTGYSELALRSLGPDDKLRPKIEVIKSAGERAAGLTRQLLAFSRKQMLQPKVLDLNGVVTGIAQMLPRMIGEHIDLRFRLGDSLGQIKADPSQIEQVLMNLAVNARDAMPGGGCLIIETENVHLTGKFGRSDLTVEPGHYVMMAVSDTGSGMDEETQAHIFEPFFTTKEVGKGTGLGLSTVYGIVKQSGGSLWVYSEMGKGTTFKIYLPRVDEIIESDALEGESAQVSRGQETVLLVEDEEVVRNLSREILETYGYSVLVASNGKEGLRIGEEFPGKIDLVITDVIMPLMGGPEMTESFKASRPETRVLFMSGFTDDAIVHHGVLDESVSFLQKPFSLESLASKAREVLDQV
jgi:PAS domain S-box-containing protein